MFQNRTDAAHELGDLLDRHDVEVDIGLGVPRGALPVVRPVADTLGVPLDIAVAVATASEARSTSEDVHENALRSRAAHQNAKRSGDAASPERPSEHAVASDGSVWLSDELIDRLDVPEEYVERERDCEAENARAKAERYREGQGAPDLTGTRVAIVDDGIATGATADACLKQVYEAGADHVILAVPVGSPDATEDLEDDADDVLAVRSPPHFRAVGQAYERFEQVSDREATTYFDIERSSGTTEAATD